MQHFHNRSQFFGMFGKQAAHVVIHPFYIRKLSQHLFKIGGNFSRCHFNRQHIGGNINVAFGLHRHVNDDFVSGFAGSFHLSIERSARK